MEPQQVRILVVTATEMEKQAVLDGIEKGNIQGSQTHQQAVVWDVFHTGVGCVQAAVQVMSMLEQNPYDLIIGTGIAGGFRISNGSLVLANQVVAADLGIDDMGQFQSIKELGFGEVTLNCHSQHAVRVYEWIQGQQERPKCYFGAVLSVNTVTGSLIRANQLLAQTPGAFAEDMKSYGIALAAKQWKIPVLILRAISNPVGPRDRSSWQIESALDSIRWFFSSIPSAIWVGREV